MMETNHLTFSPIVCPLIMFSNKVSSNIASRFGECVNANEERINLTEVANKTVCDSLAETMNYTWISPKINFDNVFNAYLALLQVVSVWDLLKLPKY